MRSSSGGSIGSAGSGGSGGSSGTRSSDSADWAYENKTERTMTCVFVVCCCCCCLWVWLVLWFVLWFVLWSSSNLNLDNCSLSLFSLSTHNMYRIYDNIIQAMMNSEYGVEMKG